MSTRGVGREEGSTQWLVLAGSSADLLAVEAYPHDSATFGSCGLPGVETTSTAPTFDELIMQLCHGFALYELTCRHVHPPRSRVPRIVEIICLCHSNHDCARGGEGNVVSTGV